MIKVNCKASIIVPTYNTGPLLADCIDHLLSQQCDHNYEIIISDDGSTDKTAELMQYYVEDHNDRVVYLRHENVRLSENRNIGARAACGEILVFLDADMIASQNFLQAHIENCQKMGLNSITLGNNPVHKSCLKYPVGRFLSKKWERRLTALSKNPNDYSLLQGGNFSIWKEFFWQVGGFDHTFIEYGGEDVDFFIRAGGKGAVFGFSSTAYADQFVEESFLARYKKAGHIVRAKRILHSRYPSMKVDLPQTIPLHKRNRSIKEFLLSTWTKLPFSYQLVLVSLPLLEKTLSDHYLFYVYESLLSYKIQQEFDYK